MSYTRTLIRILIGLMLMSLVVDALVHYTKGEPGATEGCQTGGQEMLIDGHVKHPDLCGIYVCQNNKGDLLLHYCQIPASFGDCDGKGVKTDAEWPDCCWLCVTEVNCAKNEETTTPDPIRIK